MLHTGTHGLVLNNSLSSTGGRRQKCQVTVWLRMSTDHTLRVPQSTERSVVIETWSHLHLGESMSRQIKWLLHFSWPIQHPPLFSPVTQLLGIGHSLWNMFFSWLPHLQPLWLFLPNHWPLPFNRTLNKSSLLPFLIQCNPIYAKPTQLNTREPNSSARPVTIVQNESQVHPPFSLHLHPGIHSDLFSLATH